VIVAAIDAGLLQAYMDARYAVEGGSAPLVLRVGAHAVEIADLHEQARSVALITACNPGSRPLGAAANMRRMTALDEALREAGLPARPALHCAPDGTWTEDSRAVPADDLATIDRIARAFGQLAVVIVGEGQVRLRCYAEPPIDPRVDTRFVDFVPCATAPADAMTEYSDEFPAPLLSARRLIFRRGEERIFGPLDFTLEAGGVLVIEGGNGAGKTSLLRVLAGLLSASENGDEGDEPEVRVNHSVALLGHSLGLTGELDAVENLRFAAGLQGNGGGMTPLNALRGVGLEGYEDIPVGRLSAGQRKRVALARLLVAPAATWLLDEPYANLDPEGIALVNRLIERHTHAGGGVALTSHGAQLPLNQAATVVKL
jgi:heme exporter protein A